MSFMENGITLSNQGISILIKLFCDEPLAGVYEIDGPIIIGSNTILTGDPDAIIKVSSSSSQWFTGSIGIISCKESIKNVSQPCY